MPSTCARATAPTPGRTRMSTPTIVVSAPISAGSHPPRSCTAAQISARPLTTAQAPIRTTRTSVVTPGQISVITPASTPSMPATMSAGRWPPSARPRKAPNSSARASAVMPGQIRAMMPNTMARTPRSAGTQTCLFIAMGLPLSLMSCRWVGFRSGSDRFRRGWCARPGDGQLAGVVEVDQDGRPVVHVNLDRGAADTGLHLALDVPAERARAEHRVEAGPRDMPARGIGNPYRDLAFGQPVAQLVEHEVDDAFDLGHRQWLPCPGLTFRAVRAQTRSRRRQRVRSATGAATRRWPRPTAGWLAP